MKAEAALVEGIAHIVAHITRIGKWRVSMRYCLRVMVLAFIGGCRGILYLGECNLCFLIV
jgi:hypothetical protein